MINLLVNILVALSFDFYLPDTSTAGQAVNLRIEAMDNGTLVDTLNAVGFLELETPFGTSSSYLSPYTVTFVNGISTSTVSFFCAGYVRLKLSFPGMDSTWYSQYFTVLPDQYSKINLLFPGDSLRPLEGVIHTVPLVFSVGEYVPVRIVYSDAYYNIIPGQTDSLSLMLWDTLGQNPYASFSPYASGDFTTWDTVILQARRASQYAYLIASSQNFQDTTDYIYFTPASPARVVLLFPGETYTPGNPAAGKTGLSQNQYAGNDFQLTVILTDIFHNRVLSPGVYAQDTVKFVASPGSGVSINPLREFGDSTKLSYIANFAYPGTYWVTAYVEGTSLSPDSSSVTVTQRPDIISLTASKVIIRSNEIDTIFAKVTAQSGYPVAGQEVRFSIVSGSGSLIPLISYTNIQGTAYTILNPGLGGQFITVKGETDSLSDTIRIEVLESREDTMTLFADSLYFYPSPLNSDNKVSNIEYLLPNSVTKVEIRIFDPFGHLVYSKTVYEGEEGAIPGTWNRITWDGKNNHGKKVQSGMYILTLSAYRNSQKIKSLKKRIGVLW